MFKITIDKEDVVCDKDFTIQEEMLNTPSVILNNVYPRAWEQDQDYISRFYHPNDYSKCKIFDETIINQSEGTTVSGTSFQINYDDKRNFDYYLLGNTSQTGTPTPTSPVPVNTTTGREDINVIGKNYFDYTTTTFSLPANVSLSFENNTITMTTTTTTTSSNLFLRTKIPDEYLQNGATYTISSENISGMVNSLKLQLRNKDGSNANLSTGTSITYNDTYSLFVVCNPFATTGSTSIPSGTTAVVKNVQVEKSSTSSTYEAYKGHTYIINLGGDNLLPNELTSRTEYGITITNNNNGTYTVNGTATSDVSLAVNVDTFITMKGTWRLVGCPAGGSSSTYMLSAYVGYWGSGSPNIDTGNGTNITYTGNVKIRFYIKSGTTCNNLLFKPMLTYDTSATYNTFTPYTTTPIELCKIGNYQDFIRKGTGKNLLDTSTAQNGYFYTSSGTGTSGNWYIQQVPVETNTSYYLSGNTYNNTAAKIVLLNSDKTIIQDLGGYKDVHSITTTSNTAYIGVSIADYNGTGDMNTIMLEKGTTQTLYEPYDYKDKWYIYKAIGKVVLNGSENWLYGGVSSIFYIDSITDYAISNNTPYSNYYGGVSNVSGASNMNTNPNNTIGFINRNDIFRFYVKDTRYTTTPNDLKTWLSNNNVSIYYVLATPYTEDIEDSELLTQLNEVELLSGLNNIQVSSPYLPFIMTLHYNFNDEYTIEDLYFCGVVKNSGNISLNPREPHYQSLQILSYKTFLSEGETLDFVIYEKTIREAIEQVVGAIKDYGFIVGNINLLNPDEMIGAYSTKDKSAYDVFNYIADITQSRWTTRMIDEDTIAIDFYDPSLMEQGTTLEYTDEFFRNNLIDNMYYSYGTNDYRNKQVMTSQEVYSNINQSENIIANGYQTQYNTEQPIGKINSIKIGSTSYTFATTTEKEMGYTADFYYTPGYNFIENQTALTVGSVLSIDYVPIVEGRQIITNSEEIDRVAQSTGVKGIVARYENRNDATTSTELQLIGQSYIKYKGTPEIVLTVETRNNLWEVGQRVPFNAPIPELKTEYMVRSKKINRIVSIDTIFYTYELTSSFNSETAINYFDNQRAKANGNIGSGEYISRNIDIESTANIIFYDSSAVEITTTGDNKLNCTLEAPFVE